MVWLKCRLFASEAQGFSESTDPIPLCILGFHASLGLIILMILALLLYCHLLGRRLYVSLKWVINNIVCNLIVSKADGVKRFGLHLIPVTHELKFIVEPLPLLKLYE